MRGASWIGLVVWLGLAAGCGSSEDAAEEPAKECSDGQTECSEDALTARVCEAGSWKSIECMRDQGQLCESGSCVDPWRLGSPSFDQCADEPRRTPESLAQKADYFEEAARRLHIHPQLGWLSNVVLKTGVAESTATVADVESWDSSENDGLWSALYLGAEAYRYAVTRDPEARDTLALLMDAEAKRMRITGVPGIFTRQLIPPGVSGIGCPTDLAAYVPDVEKDDNRWVRVGSGGCLESVDGATLAWKTSSVCGLEEFAGWCFYQQHERGRIRGSCSASAPSPSWWTIQASGDGQDAARPDRRSPDRASLTFVDWDGRVTEHRVGSTLARSSAATTPRCRSRS
jgi:hypothetical protein